MDWALTGATVGLIIAFCYLLDWLVSKKEQDKQKVAIIKWWSRLDDFSYSEAVRNSNIFCNEIFNRIYGKRHLSLRCFAISSCVSILSVLILTTVLKGSFDTGAIAGYFAIFPFMLKCTPWANLWIDYISLIETRFILRFASRVKPIMLPVLLLVDLFLSSLIFWFGLTLVVSYLRLQKGDRVIGEPEQYLRFFRALFKGKQMFLSVLFYSTFSTSVIFYIFCLSTLLFKFVKLSKTRIMVVLEKLEDSDHLIS